jgi:hypothetical protein
MTPPEHAKDEDTLPPLLFWERSPRILIALFAILLITSVAYEAFEILSEQP